MKCKECNGKLHHETKREWLKDAAWIPSYNNRMSRGFYINQMYSSTIQPYELAELFLKAQFNVADEQEFYNSKLGLAHTVDGARITDVMIDQCIGDYRKNPSKNQNRLITMGVDVGRWLHYEICEWILPQGQVNDLNVESKCRVIDFGKLQHFEELDLKMREHRVNFCVIDANPERRKACEFANRFWGHVKMCFYGRGIQGKQLHAPKEDTGEPTITVDRTSWLDLSLGRFRAKTISLPQDINEEYKHHLKELVRVYEKDPDGNPVGRYVKGVDDDHYAHARNYAEIALPFAAGFSVCEDITEDVM